MASTPILANYIRLDVLCCGKDLAVSNVILEFSKQHNINFYIACFIFTVMNKTNSSHKLKTNNKFRGLKNIGDMHLTKYDPALKQFWH